MTKTETLPPKKILAFCPGGLGDVVLFTPVLVTLRERFPNATIHLIIEQRCMALAPYLPGVDEPTQVHGLVVDHQAGLLGRLQVFWDLLARVRTLRPDATVFAGTSPFLALVQWLGGARWRVGYGAGWFQRLSLCPPALLLRQVYTATMHHQLALALTQHPRGAQGARVAEPPSPEKPPLPQHPQLLSPTSAEAAEASMLLGMRDPACFTLLVHPGASKISQLKGIVKHWPPQRWATAMAMALAQWPNMRVVLLGGPDDAETLAAIREALRDVPADRWRDVSTKPISVGVLLACLQQGDALLCLDSAPMHLAVSMDTPVVALFGATDPQKLLPETWLKSPVKAVALKGGPIPPLLDGTSVETGLDISVASVLAAIGQLYEQPRPE